MKLYELSQNYNNLYDLLENEEVPVEVVADALKEIEDNIETKFENISKLIKDLEGSVEAFKTEEKRLSTRRKTFENKVKSLKSYMLEQLDIMERTKIQANTFVVRKQKSPSGIAVYDQDKLDKKFFIEQPSKVDTKAIKVAIDKGEEVDGAGYSPDSYHVRIQ